MNGLIGTLAMILKTKNYILEISEPPLFEESSQSYEILVASLWGANYGKGSKLRKTAFVGCNSGLYADFPEKVNDYSSRVAAESAAERVRTWLEEVYEPLFWKDHPEYR